MKMFIPFYSIHYLFYSVFLYALYDTYLNIFYIFLFWPLYFYLTLTLINILKCRLKDIDFLRIRSLISPIIMLGVRA